MHSPQQEGFAYEWGLGHPMKQGLVDILIKYEIPSVIGVQVDSFLVDAIFGQHASKPSHRHHDVKSLSLEAPKTNGSIRKDVWKDFEDLKQQLILDLDKNPSPTGYIKKVEKFCPIFMQSFQDFGKRVEEILPWFVQL